MMELNVVVGLHDCYIFSLQVGLPVIDTTSEAYQVKSSNI